MMRLSAAVGLELVSYDRPGKLVPVSLILFQLARMLGLRAWDLGTKADWPSRQSVRRHARGAAETIMREVGGAMRFFP